MKLDSSECIQRFVHYEKKTKSPNGGTTTQLLVGVTADKPGYFHESISDYAEFKDTPKKVPSGYKKWPDTKSQQFARDFYCKSKSKKAEKVKSLEGLEESKWYNESRKHWLTIGDLLSLKSGNELDILLYHRNALDAPMTYFKSDTSYTPKKFFKSERDTLVASDETLMCYFKNYEKHDPTHKYLEVEYKRDKWYPLEDGFLPASKNKKGKKIHFTELPKKTPVGFRGPMILWKELSKLPKIYFSEE